MIHVDPPPFGILWTAVSIYLEHAYGAVIPVQVTAQLERLRAAQDSGVYATADFERDPAVPPTCYSLRLGNRHYPHMKLVVEHMPARGHWFFRVDTHDLHIHLPPTDPEYEGLRRLHAQNGALAAEIEAAWEVAGVPTFRGFLRRDLDARRR